MKILCDVCDVEEASVFCSADEAALCEACDRRVHHANKLASKHLRFSLTQTASRESSPVCDICQEKRALLFCQQDRALLCKECDGPVHNANKHTQKHTRFLLTGGKLSTSSAPFQATSSSSCSGMSNNTGISANSSADPVNLRANAELASNNFPAEMESSSSISEYLIETLPGWHVDEILEPSCSLYPYSFSSFDQNTPSFGQAEFAGSYGYFSPMPQTPGYFKPGGIYG